MGCKQLAKASAETREKLSDQRQGKGLFNGTPAGREKGNRTGCKGQDVDDVGEESGPHNGTSKSKGLWRQG